MAAVANRAWREAGLGSDAQPEARHTNHSGYRQAAAVAGLPKRKLPDSANRTENSRFPLQEKRITPLYFFVELNGPAGRPSLL